jgi:hypothetical protein
VRCGKCRTLVGETSHTLTRNTNKGQKANTNEGKAHAHAQHQQGRGADQVYKDINSFDKSLTEKLAFIEGLDKKDKIAFYAVLDAFIGKKKLKDALANVLSDVKL